MHFGPKRNALPPELAAQREGDDDPQATVRTGPVGTEDGGGPEPAAVVAFGVQLLRAVQLLPAWDSR